MFISPLSHVLWTVSNDCFSKMITSHSDSLGFDPRGGAMGWIAICTPSLSVLVLQLSSRAPVIACLCAVQFLVLGCSAFLLYCILHFSKEHTAQWLLFELKGAHEAGIISGCCGDWDQIWWGPTPGYLEEALQGRWWEGIQEIYQRENAQNSGSTGLKAGGRAGGRSKMAFTEAKNKKKGGIRGRGRWPQFAMFTFKVYGTIRAMRSGMPLDIWAWSLERGLFPL